MNALLLEPEPMEEIRMREDEQYERLLGEMRSDIRHLQSDVTDIKADQRIGFDKIDDRFDKVDARFEKIDDRFDKVDDRFQKMEDRFDKVDVRFQKMDDKVDARFLKADDRFGSIEKGLADLKVSLASAKVWAIGLYVAFAGTMLLVMARGFKWL